MFKLRTMDEDKDPEAVISTISPITSKNLFEVFEVVFFADRKVALVRI
jgi:hypothetical protein